MLWMSDKWMVVSVSGVMIWKKEEEEEKRREMHREGGWMGRVR